MMNLHMQHMEDCVIDGNLKTITDIIVDYHEFLSDCPSYQYNLSIKYDGAPAIFAWSKFPGLEKPGIAMKGLFNLKPTIFYTEKDLQHLPEDLQYKLNVLLENLPKIKIPKNEIWQGDFLFDDKSLKREKIKEQEMLCFHPNALIYLVPTKLIDTIKQAKVGIVWHTTYTGKKLNEVKCSFYVDVDRLHKNKNVYSIDAIINPAHIKFSINEMWKLDQKVEMLKIGTKALLSFESYKNIIENEDLKTYFKLYQNFVIKERAIDFDIPGFILFLKNRFEKEINEKKSEKGKENTTNKRDVLINFIKENEATLKIMLAHINTFNSIKEIWLNAFNKIGVFETYIKTTEGKIERTSQEGFALSDVHGNVIKIVNRKEFSYRNFSAHTIKGWTKKS